jgi:hypothetical protein
MKSPENQKIEQRMRCLSTTRGVQNRRRRELERKEYVERRHFIFTLDSLDLFL